MRSRVVEAKSLAAPFFFSFDSRSNSQAQFVVMSLSGFAVTGVALYVAYGLLPAEAGFLEGGGRPAPTLNAFMAAGPAAWAAVSMVIATTPSSPVSSLARRPRPATSPGRCRGSSVAAGTPPQCSDVPAPP